MQLRLYSSMGREIDTLEPIVPGKIGLYSCGPTVYSYQHIGNLRTYLFVDILKRTLEYIGYEVNHVMNVTDVGHLTDDADQGEDKMIKSAREKKMSVWDISAHYAGIFFDDLQLLNIRPATVICKATDHIGDMIELIAELEKKGFTYTAGGNVYFDIGRFPNYGKLALLDLSELKAGARTRVDKDKKNPHDFALWFTRSKFEHQTMLWDSPWGRGYPGWHIECSAMSMKYLGDQFDIHCGGADHISVHHTNEIAQSEAAIGRKWVNHWLHGEMLLMGREKMAKSRGKPLILSELVERGYTPMDYRYYSLGAHYRAQLGFSLEALDGARKARIRLDERVARLKSDAGQGALPAGDAYEGASGYIRAFERNATADLNMPRCLADLWGLVRDEGVDAGPKLAAVYQMDKILGLKLEERADEQQELEPDLQRLIADRDAARESKDYMRADEIRNQLMESGILLEDTPSGVKWKRK